MGGGYGLGEKFFDRVNHDVLISRVARHVDDARVLKLIRRYLEAGLMRDGVSTARDKGTPQGGPLSPLLSNILLDDWDRELEKRGHAFCSYADDCNIYLRSAAAGERVMAAMQAFLEDRLTLQINAAKSACARPWKRTFLGYTLTNVSGRIRLRVAPQSVLRLTGRVRELLRQGRGRSLTHTIETLDPVLRGWLGYSSAKARRCGRTSTDGRGVGCVACYGDRPRRVSDAPRCCTRAGLAFRPQRSRPVVEQRCQPHESGAPKRFLLLASTGLAAQHQPVSSVSLMNRRMRNRTYGGVGGGRSIPAPYPIICGTIPAPLEPTSRHADPRTQVSIENANYPGRRMGNPLSHALPAFWMSRLRKRDPDFNAPLPQFVAIVRY
ncbi:MAG TPA: reverse transcriptase domain-containing protein [Dokdonella sp.]|nr:reverse transcriptase domain-containing protein [Dokdonella sp.]